MPIKLLHCADIENTHCLYCGRDTGWPEDEQCGGSRPLRKEINEAHHKLDQLGIPRLSPDSGDWIKSPWTLAGRIMIATAKPGPKDK